MTMEVACRGRKSPLPAALLSPVPVAGFPITGILGRVPVAGFPISGILGSALPPTPVCRGQAPLPSGGSSG